MIASLRPFASLAAPVAALVFAACSPSVEEEPAASGDTALASALDALCSSDGELVCGEWKLAVDGAPRSPASPPARTVLEAAARATWTRTLYAEKTLELAVRARARGVVRVALDGVPALGGRLSIKPGAHTLTIEAERAPDDDQGHVVVTDVAFGRSARELCEDGTWTGYAYVDEGAGRRPLEAPGVPTLLCGSARRLAFEAKQASAPSSTSFPSLSGRRFRTHWSIDLPPGGYTLAPLQPGCSYDDRLVVSIDGRVEDSPHATGCVSYHSTPLLVRAGAPRRALTVDHENLAGDALLALELRDARPGETWGPCSEGASCFTCCETDALERVACVPNGSWCRR